MIRPLPEYLINKLKAGEIVERPASVVKELIENALDASATAITVSLQDGGMTLIHVQDDGTGIATNDVDLVLERYATSKIIDEKDLTSIASYGFRGEALASISEVSNLTIQTITVSDQVGHEITKHDTLISTKSIPMNITHGTSVLVRDLYYNTPARAKFLKTPQTEYKYCQELFLQYARQHLDISWTLIHNNKTIYQLPTTKNLTDRLDEVYHKSEWNGSLHMISTGDETLSICGICSDAHLTFPTPKQMKIRVNSRPIQDKIIKKAIMDAYKHQFPPREYPLIYLFVTIDPRLVDVNVHPRKTEVKFLDTQMVFGAVKHAVVKALQSNKFHQSVPFGGSSSQSFSSQEKGETRGRYSVSSRTPNKHNITRGNVSIGSSPRREKEGNIGLFPQNDMFSSAVSEVSNSSDIIVIGQARDRYIIAQMEDGLYCIDQHALAERITFERMRRQAQTQQGTTRTLLTPLSVQIPASTGAFDDDRMQIWKQLGFDMELLSETSLAIYGVPLFLQDYTMDLQKVIEIIIWMDNPSLDDICAKVFASRACKTSIKSGEHLSLPQMQQLITDGLAEIPGSLVCQHGRPFFMKFDKIQIDKGVGRE